MGSVLEGRSTELFIVRALRLCIVRTLRLCAMTYTPIRAAQLVDATRACGVCSPRPRDSTAEPTLEPRRAFKKSFLRPCVARWARKTQGLARGTKRASCSHTYGECG